MERHQNQNAFIWKRMKLTVCITAQYTSVTMMGFKVKEVAENMLTPSTVGSFISTKGPQTPKLATNSSEIPKKSSASGTDGDISHAFTKQCARLIPSFSPSGLICDEFTNCLNGSGGGYKKDRPAQQIVNRCFLKFLKFCCEEEEELNLEVMDFGLCSQACCSNLLTFCKKSAKLDIGGDWAT